MRNCLFVCLILDAFGSPWGSNLARNARHNVTRNISLSFFTHSKCNSTAPRIDPARIERNDLAAIAQLGTNIPNRLFNKRYTKTIARGTAATV